MSEPNWEEINKDKEAKKLAVIEHITSKCTPDSDIDDLRTIGACLSNGGKLNIEILTGGNANYSYKISCIDASDGGAEHKIFAKLSFPYAVLFPDMPCPPSRTEEEYKMMAIFDALNPGLVPVPYFCDDVGDNMKLIVTQWSPVDEQFGNQFIDGNVDIRTSAKIAEGISKLHAKETNADELSFNSDMTPFVRSIIPLLSLTIGGLHEPGSQDRAATLAKQLGEEETTAAINSYISTLDEAECIIHGDLHCFNILVGKKPSIECLENFEATGSVTICDFEFSRGAVPGIDVGALRAFPISCAFAHALNGHRPAADNCLDWVNSFWSTYEAKARDAGKTDEDLKKIYRQAMQCTGLWLLAYYGMGLHADLAPIEEGNAEEKNRFKESLGLVGLKFLMWGMDEGLTLEQLKKSYKEAIEDEVSQLPAIKKVRRNRRSSLLRASGRRVSDANLHFAEFDRKSFASADGASILSRLENLSTGTTTE